MFFFVLGVLLTLSLFLFQLLPFVLQLILTSLETVSHENVLQVVFFVQEPLCCHLFGHVFSFFKFSLCFLCPLLTTLVYCQFLPPFFQYRTRSLGRLQPEQLDILRSQESIVDDFHFHFHHVPRTWILFGSTHPVSNFHIHSMNCQEVLQLRAVFKFASHCLHCHFLMGFYHVFEDLSNVRLFQVI